MISEIFILFFKASLTIRHTATVSQKKSGTSKKIQWDFQISRVGSLDFLDLKVNGSPAYSEIYLYVLSHGVTTLKCHVQLLAAMRWLCHLKDFTAFI